ncbi:hypothetical protein WICPIJ_005399 [Wickerhamomyces pijperi]|uniref:Uncharacterized protein n=1 Tax=Wickerhamomyces pijperi TaxID=599730 RepID=A0A9P8Q444_WICPI|nr:hypothetical protein WICPIJ_005399 [Wickerhamomyces pijperi]
MVHVQEIGNVDVHGPEEAGIVENGVDSQRSEEHPSEKNTNNKCDVRLWRFPRLTTFSEAHDDQQKTRDQDTRTNIIQILQLILGSGLDHREGEKGKDRYRHSYSKGNISNPMDCKISS